MGNIERIQSSAYLKCPRRRSALHPGKLLIPLPESKFIGNGEKATQADRHRMISQSRLQLESTATDSIRAVCLTTLGNEGRDSTIGFERLQKIVETNHPANFR